MSSRLLSPPLMALLLVGCGDSVRHPAPAKHQQSATEEPGLTQGAEEEVVRSTPDESPQERSYEIQLAAGAAHHAVYEGAKREEIVLLELFNDRVAFTALISRRKYEEVMTLKPPAYFEREGLEYVKNDLFFWGESGKEEQVSVDGKVFPGFTLDSDSAQIVARGAQVESVLEALAAGESLKLEKHYWSDAREKGYPVFHVGEFRESLSQLKPSSASALTVRESETRCESFGAGKVVWLDNPEGVFALNGQAMQLVQNGGKDVPWESRGRPVYIGRDILGVSITQALIEAGLKKCR